MSLKTKKMFLFLLSALLLVSLCVPAAAEEAAAGEEITEEVLLDEDMTVPDSAGPEPASPSARDAFIDDIIAAGKEVYDKADGKYMRAHYKNDIYVCKNFFHRTDRKWYVVIHVAERTFIVAASRGDLKKQ